MCGIIGFVANKKDKRHIDILYSLFKQSKIRGLHSFGFSYYNNKKITTIKSFTFPKKHIFLDYYHSDNNKIILHNRYSTSGDWNNMNNNQPITTGIDLSVAMNGVISMKEKKEFEKEFNVECITDNDTEILARKIEEGKNVEKFLNKISGSVACVYIYKDKIYAIRNSKRPLHCFVKYDGIFVCSTKDIIKRAIRGVKIYSLKSGRLFDLEKLLRKIGK